MDNQRPYWRIVENINRAILNGTYPAGSRLPAERELAEQYQVSRATIREAVIALEVQKKVEVKTGSGVYVLATLAPPHTPLNAFELTQARALIEGEIAALAATKITDNELAELQQTLIAMENTDYLEEADQRFHQIIARATGNGGLLLSFNTLWALRSSTRAIADDYRSVCSKDNTFTIAEHTAIYQALKKRDSVAARQAMHKHFGRLLNALFDETEAKALADLQRRSNAKRDRYSLDKLLY
ncbi:MAG: FadR/GntR family transcriptional regulator [Ferrimonas sp.]